MPAFWTRVAGLGSAWDRELVDLDPVAVGVEEPEPAVPVPLHDSAALDAPLLEQAPRGLDVPGPERDVGAGERAGPDLALVGAELPSASTVDPMRSEAYTFTGSSRVS